MKHILYVRKKPYYFYKIISDWNKLQSFKRKYPKVKYYWVKQLNKRTGRTTYAVYLDHQIS